MKGFKEVRASVIRRSIFRGGRIEGGLLGTQIPPGLPGGDQGAIAPFGFFLCEERSLFCSCGPQRPAKTKRRKRMIYHRHEKNYADFPAICSRNQHLSASEVESIQNPLKFDSLYTNKHNCLAEFKIRRTKLFLNQLSKRPYTARASSLLISNNY